MIKVLKEGNKFNKTCDKCNAELEYQLEDVNEDDFGRNELERYIKCPCCGNKIYITYKEMILMSYLYKRSTEYNNLDTIIESIHNIQDLCRNEECSTCLCFSKTEGCLFRSAEPYEWDLSILKNNL